MKSVPFFQSNGFYVAASFASANTFFFKYESECKTLHSKIRTYLQSMIDIIELRCFPGGWILLFKTKSANQIKQSYSRMNKDKEQMRFVDVEHILSEQFRIANSMTVKECNAYSYRSGSRIHSKLVKLIFDSKEEYELLLDKMEKIQLFTNQNLLEYYPEIGKVLEECGIKNIFRIRDKRSFKKKVRQIRKFYGQMSISFQKLSESIKKTNSQYYSEFKAEVILKLINNTKNKHKIQSQPQLSIFGLP